MHNKRKQTEQQVYSAFCRQQEKPADFSWSPELYKTVQRGFSKICPHSWDGHDEPTNMHGHYMAAKALVLSFRSTVIMWLQTQVMQQYLFDSKTHIIEFRYTCNVLNTRLLNTHCQPEIYLLREMKVEPDLTLVQDESSVRYE